MKRIVTLFITFSFLLTVFAACSDTDSGGSERAPAGTAEASSRKHTESISDDKNSSDSNATAEISVNAEKRGNTIENSNMNRGIAAIDGEWLYLAAGLGIYKTRESGGSFEKIIDEQTRCYNLNYYDGYLYYIKDQAAPLSDKKSIVKIKTDGSDNQILIEGNEILSLTVVNDIIYYWDNDTIYKMNLDGSDITAFVNDVKFHFVVMNGFAYYITKAQEGEEEKERLCRINIDGGEPQILTNGHVDIFVTDGNLLYYFIASTTEDFSDCGRWSVSLDGTNHKMEREKNIFNDAFNTAYKGMLYIGHMGKLKRVNDDTVISEKRVNVSYSIINDNFYYDTHGETVIRKAGLDGSSDIVFFDWYNN